MSRIGRVRVAVRQASKARGLVSFFCQRRQGDIQAESKAMAKRRVPV